MRIVDKIFILIFPVNFLISQSIVDSKHNLSASGSGSIKAVSEQEICIFCHTPHGASPSAQLWNHELTSQQSYELYSSDYLLSRSYTSPSQPNPRSKLCLSCHDGTVALGSVFNLRGSSGVIEMQSNGAPITTMPTHAAGYIGTSLKDDHPVGYVYDTSKDPELVVRSWPWNTPVRLDPDAPDGTVECHTCHDPHNDQYGKFLRMSNDNAGLCTFCHNKTGWTLSAHATSNQNYTPDGYPSTTVGEWACRNCHKSHSGAGIPYILIMAEETTCYNENSTSCHSSNGIKPISTVMNRTYSHPTNSVSGVHKNPESSDELANRHAECQDCHNPHQAQPGTHDGTTRDLPGALKGTWGVEPDPWPEAPTGMTNNDNTFAVPSQSSYVVRNPATSEYQICLKCHSNYTTQPAGQRNIAAEINPNYPSYHGIVPGGQSNPYCNSITMNEPWGTYKIVTCSDCHGSNVQGDPKGPHGSNLDNMLVETIVSDNINGTPLCYICHKRSNYWDGILESSNFNKHPSKEEHHKEEANYGCFTCHMYEYSTKGSITGGNSGKIFIHGMNKRFYYNEKSGSVSNYKEYSDAFVDGYVEDISFTERKCTPVCHGTKRYRSKN
jgi:predicted CXXCH cytochrome family protein